MTTTNEVLRPTTRTISTDELHRRLSDPGLTIVDVRPIAAYNGWRLQGEARGGHIPGATIFPSAWLRSVDEAEIKRLLLAKGITPDRTIVVYGDGAEDAPALDARLAELGHDDVLRYEAGFPAWAADDAPADRAPPELRPPRPRRVAPPAARRRAPRGLRQRQVPALPRQLRRARGVRGEPPPGRPLPRHEPARGPGRLEPPVARRDRRHAACPRHHPRHDRRPLRPRHRRRRQREVAGPAGRADRRDAGRADPALRRRRRTSGCSTAATTGGSPTAIRSRPSSASPRRSPTSACRSRSVPTTSSTSARPRRSWPTRPARRSSASGPGASTSAT